MRGIVVATVLSLTAWTFLTWCGVCACTWLEQTSFSASALALTSSFAAIVCAAAVGAIWVGCLPFDGDAMDGVELDLVAD
jgi:hypothetical protein